LDYKVLSVFLDTDGIEYAKGQKYSKELTDAREQTLTTNKNAYGKPFLELLAEQEKKEKVKPETKKKKK